MTTTMYGKRRVVVSRENRVSLQGSKSGRGGSYAPCGKLEFMSGKWNAIGLRNDGLPSGVWVGEFDTKQEAKRALLVHYRSTDHCLFPEEISDSGDLQ